LGKSANKQAIDTKDHFALCGISVIARTIPQDDLPAVATDELFARGASLCCVCAAA
jgi:hypothetical protein